MARAGSERQNRGLVMLRGGLLAVLLIFIIPTAHAVAPMVVTGAWHTLALKSDGTVWGWGMSDGLGLGEGVYSYYPAQLPISGVRSVVAGADQSFALKNDGTLWAWGWNAFGVLGLGDTIARYSSVQVPISRVVGISSEGAISGHTGLAGNGTIWYTTNFSTRANIPGGLNRLVAGDFNDDGRDDLAGLAGNGTIWYTTNRATWTNIPGQLNRLAGED